jgi:hypothetical protein
MITSNIITGPVLAMLVLDGIKWVVRKFMKDPAYEFSTTFYYVMLPVLNILAPYGLFALGLSVLPTYSWETLVQMVGIVVLESLITLGAYNITLKPFKEYRDELAEKAKLAAG